ncbi:MAG: hypothetical protein RJB62_1640 [Pseudomonadota bacterium]|jgi:predicted 3-demethylubiquinone-9 3-methyltransferase (glyoxalase superfamily)
MAKITQKITPCLWFNRDAEEAAQLYISVFGDGKINKITRYGKEGFEFHGMPEGTAMTVDFTLAGQNFLALNGGPAFTFSEAVSLIIRCSDQDEVDHFWNGLGPAGGGTESQCGWLKDKFGFSWQVTPTILNELMSDPDKAKASRVMNAMLQMKKIDIAELKRAAAG